MTHIYKCPICNNIVEVIIQGTGNLICCGKPMQLLKERTQDVGQEKHLPVVEKTDNGVKVKVGSIPHPMEEQHFIQWIEVIADGEIQRKNLKPGESPEAEFCIKAEKYSVREYCNLHGLWIV